MPTLPRRRSHPLRHLPNLITTARLLSVPLLAGLAWLHLAPAFAGVLVAALLSDVLDGWLARRFDLQSEAGAGLDALTQFALFFVTVFGLLEFQPQVLKSHGWAWLLVLGLWTLRSFVALVRYQRPARLQTHLSRAAGGALGLFLAWLFSVGFSPMLMGIAVTLVVVSSLEELLLMALLPTWRDDVRGLWWLAQARRAVRGR
jgi:CDP-diacylglycerol--glycerol-3-phosphate 3-phosphatidyltransferase